jgi:hypothetical protein
MNIHPEELTKKGYAQLDELKHEELVPFIQLYIKKRTKYAVFYYASNIFLLGWVAYLFVHGFNLPDYSIGERFTHFSYGLAISLALLPLHEYIHVLAYRSQGAVNTSYDANFKKFYFMALADKFVANKKEFEVVALAPFIVISTTLVIFLFFVKPPWTLTIASVLFAHTAMCSGDFGLLSYFEYHKAKEVVTFDDVENKVSYFYGRLDESKTEKP